MPRILNGEGTSSTPGIAIETANELAAYFWHNRNDLQMLRINRYGAEALPSLPESLQHLSIANAPRLYSLPELPSSVRFLSLNNCPHLRSIARLNNVERVFFSRLANLECLPPIEGDTYQTWLFITECPGLTKLENLGNNVTNLSLDRCSGIKALTSLPPSLNSLSVLDCPIEQLSLPEKLEGLVLHNCAEIQAPIQLRPEMRIIEFKGCPLVKLRTAAK